MKYVQCVSYSNLWPVWQRDAEKHLEQDQKKFGPVWRIQVEPLASLTPLFDRFGVASGNVGDATNSVTHPLRNEATATAVTGVSFWNLKSRTPKKKFRRSFVWNVFLCRIGWSRCSRCPKTDKCCWIIFVAGFSLRLNLHRAQKEINYKLSSKKK